MENKVDARKKIKTVIVYGIISVTILYYFLAAATLVSELKIQHHYNGSIRELDLFVEMEIIRAPSKYIKGHDYYGIIKLNNLRNQKLPADTIIVGLWPDSAASLSLAINRENGEIVLFNTNSIFFTSSGFNYIKVDRDSFFNPKYFEVRRNEINNQYDIYAANPEFIIIEFDTNVRNYGFKVHSTPGKIVFAPWPYNRGYSQKKLHKIVEQAVSLQEERKN